MATNWYAHIRSGEMDFDTLVNMFRNFDNVASDDETPFEELTRIVSASKKPLILAATSPENGTFPRFLKKLGFLEIARGNRTSGNGYIRLWGKLQKTGKLARIAGWPDFMCCGLRYYNDWLGSPEDYRTMVLVRIINSKSRKEIPEGYTLFASTEVARYYIANDEKFLTAL